VRQRCSQGSFRRTRAALQFLFENSLHHHDWTVFKKDAAFPSANASPTRPHKNRSSACSRPSVTPSIAPASN
jgi:hypothetical protein